MSANQYINYVRERSRGTPERIAALQKQKANKEFDWGSVTRGEETEELEKFVGTYITHDELNVLKQQDIERERKMTEMLDEIAREVEAKVLLQQAQATKRAKVV